MATFLLIAQFDLSAQVINDYQRKDHLTPAFDQWLYVGLGGKLGMNFTTVSDGGEIPSSGTSQFVPIPVSALDIRVRRDFSYRISGVLSLGYGAFGMRIRTDYPGGGRGRSAFSAQQIQFGSYIQYYPLAKSFTQSNSNKSTINQVIQEKDRRNSLVRPFIRVGLLTNINVVPSTSSTAVRFSRRFGEEPTYRDIIDIEWNSWVKPGLLTGIGLTWYTKPGYLFELVAQYHLGFSTLTTIEYLVLADDRVNPPEELLRTNLINRGTHVGVGLTIYFPPFGWNKLGPQ